MSAWEALRLGVVGEVLPAEQLMPRARQLAAQLVKLPVRMLRHTRMVLVRDLRRRLRDEFEVGLVLEALAMI